MEPKPSLLATFQKLPLFRDFSPTQLKNLIKICTPGEIAPDTFLCRRGEDSDRMFVLLSGAVQVYSDNDVPLLTEHAVSTIGEAGMLTGERRSASVRALTKLMTLTLMKRQLHKLMQEDLSLATRLYRNIMIMVRQKLMLANHRIGELLQEIEQNKKEPLESA